MAVPSTSTSSRTTRASHKRARSPSVSRPISPLPQRALRRRQPATVRERGTGLDGLASESEDENENNGDDDDYLRDITDEESDDSEVPNPPSQPRPSQPRQKGKGPQTDSNGPTSATSKARKRVTVPHTSDADQTAVNQLKVDNYKTISQDWTDHYINQLLVSRKIIVNSRPPPDVLAEAMTLQARYRRRKKVLCLIGHISEHTLEAEM